MNDIIADIELLPGAQYDYVMSDAKHPLLRGGYGSGKTRALIMRTLRELERNRAVLSDRTPGALLAPTYPMVGKILVPELMYWFDLFGLGAVYKKDDARIILHAWDAHLLLLSAGNYRRHAGLNLCFFGVDEADMMGGDQARNMWRLMVSRLRVPGSTRAGYAAGSPEGYGFLYDTWADPKKGYVDYQASSRGNWYLPEGYVEGLLAEYDPQLVRAYIDGEWVNLTGVPAAYAFERGTHVKHVAERSPYTWAGCDFNVGKMVAVIADEYAGGQVHYHAEIVLRNSNTEALAAAIRERFPAVREVYPDPAGKARSPASHTSDHQILKDHGFTVRARPAHPSHRDRLNALNRKLKDAEGRVMMTVDPACRELIRDLEQTSRDEKGGIDKGDPERTHALDACSYAIEYKWPVTRREMVSMKRVA